jgi:GxxExxY protein
MSHDYRDDHRDSSRGGGRGRGGRGGYGNGGERRGIPLSELDPATTESSHKVIGCAIEVHKTMGPGFDAEIYKGALCRELSLQTIKHESDFRIPVKYKDHTVGEVCADLLVEGRFLLCVTARPGVISTPERMCLRGKLKAAGLDLGLIINFAERRLKDGLVRVLNIEKINLDRDDASQDGGPDGTHDGGDRMHDFDGGQ